ncbi:bromodomain-containing protein [Toxoplasma gondii MAS]|uniref:Bromodomain-containing protein n=1 Tax=Toxoplasma gondii MAS TaxID=943118 RepID=A0A086PSH8_TOXGO|nr:bromodomain-containing protein [Toxoplasma gondii MAS]
MEPPPLPPLSQGVRDPDSSASFASSSGSTGSLPRHLKRKFAGIIDACRRCKDFHLFLEPVDVVAMECPTYYDLIKHPMDLTTMEEKLRNNAYSTEDDFLRDMILIFTNCRLFNRPGNPAGDFVLSLCAKSADKFVEEWCKFLKDGNKSAKAIRAFVDFFKAQVGEKPTEAPQEERDPCKEAKEPPDAAPGKEKKGRQSRTHALPSVCPAEVSQSEKKHEKVGERNATEPSATSSQAETGSSSCSPTEAAVSQQSSSAQDSLSSGSASLPSSADPAKKDSKSALDASPSAFSAAVSTSHPSLSSSVSPLTVESHALSSPLPHTTDSSSLLHPSLSSPSAPSESPSPAFPAFPSSAVSLGGRETVGDSKASVRDQGTKLETWTSDSGKAGERGLHASLKGNPFLSGCAKTWQVYCKDYMVRPLKSDRYGYLFGTPVMSSAELPQAVKENYSKIISRPMDYGTIWTKLSSRCYEHPDEFRDDVLLVSNCLPSLFPQTCCSSTA